MILGYLHHSFSNPTEAKNHFSNYSEASFLITSIVEAKQVKERVRALCEVHYAGYSTDSLKQCEGLMMVYFKELSLDQVKAGDMHLISADYVEENENTNPLVFNYKRYLQQRGIYHKIYLEKDQYFSLSTSHRNIWNLASLSRDKCLSVFKEHLTSDHNLAVASAMILGQRNLLSDDLYDAFTDTGAVHILAVSGLHVGIVSGLIALLLGFIKSTNPRVRILKLIVSLAGVWSFAFLTGGAAAVIRASLMFSLYFIGKAIYSPPISFNILSAAALIMLLYNPFYLFQAGFQFSFLALTGIMYFYPHLILLFHFKNKFIKGIWAMVVTSITAQALVSPLAISYFHKLPTYFWFTGIIAVPLAGFILSAGIATLFLHMTMGGEFVLTKIAGFTFDTFLTGLNYFIYKTQELPFCSTDDLWLSNRSILLFYAALGALALFYKLRKPIYLIFTLGFLLIQSVNNNIENRNMRSKKSLFVYDIYNESLAQLFRNGVLTEFSPGITQNKQVEYICANNEMYHRIYAEKLPAEVGINSQGSFHLIDDKVILFYPDEKVLEWSLKKPIDLLVLSQDSYHNLARLAKQFEIKKIVLDGTFKGDKFKLRQKANQLKIDIHLTSIDGALEYMI